MSTVTVHPPSSSVYSQLISMIKYVGIIIIIFNAYDHHEQLFTFKMLHVMHVLHGVLEIKGQHEIQLKLIVSLSGS